MWSCGCCGRPPVSTVFNGSQASDRVRSPDADPEDVLLFDDLLSIADPNVPLPAIDPDGVGGG